MKLIFLIALVAFASAAEKKEPVKLVNPEHPDENKVTFKCPKKGREKPYCGRTMGDGSDFMQIKWAHRPMKAKEEGFNCERMNAVINYCCDSRWVPVSIPRTTRKRLSKRAKSHDESTIFRNIPDADVRSNCDVQPGIRGKTHQ